MRLGDAMPAPQIILDLIERFERNIEAYKSGSYNETQVRREFIDPFFEALGWDVNNREGNAEAYKDVIHEDTVRVSGITKAPDYSFRIGGQRKFFVEAKKPSINLKDNPAPAFQVRRYAWSAKLPLSIVTDFDELAVYDCRFKPDQRDHAEKARVKYYTFSQYAEKWDEIAAIFSKDSILKGSFDKYAESNKTKRGTSEVDNAFLAEIESWRDTLAKNIALRNTLTVRELNDCVQRIIDRVIFLRIAEDRGIEDYGALRSVSCGHDTYARLQDLFYKADDRYNSGLFHFEHETGEAEPPDTLTTSLSIDDKPLKEILKRLYYPDSPYEFSVLPADILGQVYEQFLGKIISLTKKHIAVIEYKPEVKKAGGVFYTPTYIVEFIVENTVGKLLEGKSPKKVERLRIIDPACGSGSFLLVAYQYILDWHLSWYLNNDPKKWAKARKPSIYQGKGGTWNLSTTERKKILLNNIYGVDIDSQAVEVTKLSLLLKVLEGETGDTLDQQRKLFHLRALPDLGNNIKCGNSLIGPDFYKCKQMSFIDKEEMYRVNVFDWEREFAEVFKEGGFDVVIGNPPYLNIDDVWGKGEIRLQAIKQMYPEIYNDKTDILFYFLAKACTLSKRFVSFIVSRAFLEAYKADKLRAWLLQNSAIQGIVDFQNFYVFQGVGITTSIITLRTDIKAGSFPVFKLKNGMKPTEDLVADFSSDHIFDKYLVAQSDLSASSWSFVADAERDINEKIDAQGIPVGEILVIGKGMETGLNKVFGSRSIDDIRTWNVSKDRVYRRASNTDIQRYSIRDRSEYLLYLENVETFTSLPLGIQRYLRKHESELKERAAFQRGNCLWWKYTWPLHKDFYSQKKILCPYLSTKNRFAIDEEKKFIGLTDTTVLFDNNQPEHLYYLLGLLNSRLLTFRYKSIGKLKSGGIYEYFWNGISKLPIKRIDFKDSSDKKDHDQMVLFVGQMLTLQKRLLDAKTGHDKILIQRQIDVIDKQIDALVYELYDLSEKEIAVIEHN